MRRIIGPTLVLVVVAVLTIAPTAVAMVPPSVVAGSGAAPALGDLEDRTTGDSLITIEGDASAAEQSTVLASWRHLLDAFPTLSYCAQPVTVQVVDRAEDWYGGPVTASIAAFYRFPPAAVVFVEHGKVDAANVTHELAHHLDATCGLGEGPFGDRFLRAQGFEPGHSWVLGVGWSGVPAEHFAEAVVAHLGIAPSEIALSAAAEALVAYLAGSGQLRLV